MLNLRRLYNLDFNSAFIRASLGFYYQPGKFYRIPFGALRGMWLWYDRSINYHAVLGVWERSNFSALNKVLAKLVDKGNFVNAWDIGANIGLYSLFFARFSPQIKVQAFEPVVETLELFRKNIARNQLTNIQVVEKAAAATEGDVTFFIGHHHKSSLEKDWTSDHGTTQVKEVNVPSTTIDSFVNKFPDSKPDIIKIDVEGAGGSVFAGAEDTLRRLRPIILIESHAPYEDMAIVEMLATFRYKAFRINDSKWIRKPGNDYKDPEGVWGTMLLFPEESHSDYFS